MTIIIYVPITGEHSISGYTLGYYYYENIKNNNLFCEKSRHGAGTFGRCVVIQIQHVEASLRNIYECGRVYAPEGTGFLF